MRRAAPRVVFFDALGTLFRLTPPHEIVRQVMTRQNHPMTESEALSKLERANQWWLNAARRPGRTATEELAERRHYIRLFLEDYGRPSDTALAAHLLEDGYWARWARPYVDSHPVLATLAVRVRLALLSNGGPSLLDAVRHAGLADFFEQMAAGLEVGVQKPEPEAYLLAAARMSVAPEDCALLDDTPENVEGALDCNMRGILLDRDGVHGDWPGERVGGLERLLYLLGAHDEAN